MKRLAFLFPGQGAQYPGMGRDFFEQFSVVRECFEEADEILKRPLSQLVFKGAESELKETLQSQCGIFVTSIALLKVLQEQLPELIPEVAAGLSLGEYSALCCMEWIPYAKALPLVEKRASFMQQDCEDFPGGMVVVRGMSPDQIEEMLLELNLPDDLWATNFLSPSQTVLAGTKRGIDALPSHVRAIPIEVHGAFHSPLMRRAQERLSPSLMEAPFAEKGKAVVSNVTGDVVVESDTLRRLLIEQVSHPVLWEKGVRRIQEKGIDAYIEIGPGRTLKGINRKIGVIAPTYNLEKVEDLETLAKELKG